MSKITKKAKKLIKRKKVGLKKRPGNKHKPGVGRGLETTGRLVVTALKRYPTRNGATVQQIHRLLVKKDKARKIRRTRTLASVKLALARAVKRGSIRPPRGWNGFKGLGVKPTWVPGTPRTARDRKQSRRGSARRKSSTRRGSIRRKSSVRRASTHRRSSAFRRNSVRRGSVRAGLKRARSRSVKKAALRKKVGGRSKSKKAGMKGARGRSVSKRGMKARHGRRPRSKKNENSTETNNSGNQNGEEDEGEMAPIWRAYPCIIS